ncbi:MAG: MBL fold metallo-hydrolase [Clostridia bacterium]|nr:MBL fold metallo-hydrolase [Clostridia bacterium]
MSMVFCPLYSSSSGNATFIATKSTAILVDAGVNALRIETALAEIGASFSDIKAVIITHEHIDHIRGIGVIARRHGIPIIANHGTWEAIIEQGKAGEVPFEKRIYFEHNTTFYVGDIAITPFETHHDANSSVGYCIEHGSSKISIISDTGTVSKAMKSHIAGSDILMIEFNYDEHMLKNGGYPAFLKKRILSAKGHLSNDDAAEVVAFAAHQGCRKFVLSHLSKENNTPEAAYDAAFQGLRECSELREESVEILVARPEKVTKPIII